MTEGLTPPKKPSLAAEPARILAAGNAPQTLQLLEALLSVAGYQVSTASSGDEVRRRLKEERFNLAILDTLLVGGDGYQLCAEIKSGEQTWNIPVILVSPTGGPHDRGKGIQAGCDHFMLRPFRQAELLAATQALLAWRHLAPQDAHMERAIAALAVAVEARDPYTGGHLDRVADYALRLGAVLGLKEAELRQLRQGAILHDVGKIGVKDSILLKPGPLDESEMKELKFHTSIGERICQCFGSPIILEIVRHHHERYDGTGYPDGLAGEAIPLSARIMAVADAYDALTSDRPYRRAISLRKVLRAMAAEAGRQFDPRLVAAFLEMMKPVPRLTVKRTKTPMLDRNSADVRLD